jgi:imidazolonepropionase-like amidohydrolase
MRRRPAGGQAGSRTVAGVVALCVAASAVPLGAQTIAITGGTVYPVSGPRIERGTVLIRDGRIVAVGADIEIPAGAQRVDATGKWVTPGLIHAASRAGLGVGTVSGLGEGTRAGDVTPSFSPAEGVDPAALTLAETRTGGITTALLPPGGTFFRGHAAAIDLAGDRLDALLIRPDAALVLDLGGGSREAGGGSRAGIMARARQLFRDARTYSERRADFQRAQIQPLAAPGAELEALLPALRREVPVYVLANRRMDIENALRLGAEFGLRLVLFGAVEGWMVASELREAGVAVAVEPLRNIPSFEGLGARLDNAALLRAAGVEVILAGTDDGGDRNLRWAAGSAVAHGMTWDDALRAVTLAPALAFGLEDRGSLEPAKVANVVVWSDDPLDFRGHAERMYVRGREVSLRTREAELLERYRTLPPPG